MLKQNVTGPVNQMMSELLIAGKPVSAFTPEDYHQFVMNMYEVRIKRGTKPPSPAPGLTVSRTKLGKISIRRTAKQRAFIYVTVPEITALAEQVGCTQAMLWNLFKMRGFIIAKDRLAAEARYAELNPQK